MMRITLLSTPLLIASASAFVSRAPHTGGTLLQAQLDVNNRDLMLWLLLLTASDEYQEQENFLIRRGELEKKLLAGSSSPLEANVVKIRGTGKSGGFGGSGSASRKTTCSPAALKKEGKAHAKVLKRDGVVRIDKVLLSDQADKMREYISALRTNISGRGGNWQGAFAASIR